ncbi:MAG: KamA family radical SAM protein [Kiritimatiellales bacterium]|nr:KamA family radical SAM protein [Kiritimatiellales bacterium]
MHALDKDRDWKWQLEHRIVSGSERPSAITPYYAVVAENSVLRRTVFPSELESICGEGELCDPLGEERHRAAPNLIHTYPDKALFLATTQCAVYCRYCTRSRLVGKSVDGVGRASIPMEHAVHGIEPCIGKYALHPKGQQSRSCATRRQPSSTLQNNFQPLEESFQWLENHTEIRDVLVSGGDPLTLDDPDLGNILSRLRKIGHIKIIRVGSKVPAVLPMRITDELCAILREHRIWLSLHFTHPDELTPETQAACRKLSDAGVPMVSQTVLLKGINDDSETLKELFYGLLEINVKPYYLLQCDPVKGSAHFRTPVEKGIELIQSLHGNISGLAVPTFVIDAPGGGGKVPILGKEQIRREGDDVVVVNYEGKEFRYPDIDHAPMKTG